MQKNCEYCGSHFTFQRNTRKYCSDNCKQMAYFSRNGFTPAHGSVTKSVNTGFRAHAKESVAVKDVKHSTNNNDLKSNKNHNNNFTNEHDFEKVMEYAKCLIWNLLHVSNHQSVERDTFLELSAAWSQFVRWRSFKRAELQFPHYSLMMELETKLTVLAKVHKQSDLIEISLSQELGDQLNDCMDDMEYISDIKFNEIRF